MTSATSHAGSIKPSQTLQNQKLSSKNSVAVPAAIYQAVSDASNSVGVSFAYLMNKASTESSFDPQAKAQTSSASGLYQFISRTWLDMVDKHGAEYGLDKYADAITRTSDGTPVVKDAKLRREILDLRKDPKLSSLMAAEYADENKATLSKSLNREVTDTDLYLAHFLGASGATKFLKAMARNKNAEAANVLPDAASANTGVFFNKSGRALSLAEIYNRFEQKFTSSPTYYADGTTKASDSTQVAEASTSSASSGTDVAANSVVAQPGAITGSSVPFLTTYLLSALEVPGEVEKNMMGMANNAYKAPASSSSLYDLMG